MVWQWITNLAGSINSTLQMMYASPKINSFTEKPNLLDRIVADFPQKEVVQKIKSDIVTRQQKFQLEKLKSQILHQYLSINHQEFEQTETREIFAQKTQEIELGPEDTEKLQEFKNYWQNLQQADQNKFEKRLIEERKKQDIFLKQYDRETQILVANVTLQNTLMSTEYTRILDSHPLTIMTTPTLDFYKQYSDISKPVPPLIIISPPALEFEAYPHAAQGFSQIEARLTDELRNFLHTNYSIHNQIRPAKFLGGAINNQQFHSEAALEILHWTHKSVPTFILESKVYRDTLKLYSAWWDVMEEIPHYQKVISICWQDALYPLARENANLWRAERQQLLAAGKTIEEIIAEGGDDEYNLQVLEAETRDEKRGVKRPREYHVNGVEYTQDLADFWVLCHIVLTGLALDSYYLFNYNICPLLPELLPNLLLQIPDNDLQDKLVAVLLENYWQIYHKLKWQLPDLIPDLALDLAQKLTYLDDRSWARGQLNYALLIWLELRQVPDPLNPDPQNQKSTINSPFEPINERESKQLPMRGDRDTTNILLEKIESVLSPLDITYVDSVNQCLEALADPTQLSVVNTYYNRGIRHCQAAAYQAGIDDFSTTIFLNPEFIDAYYHRAIAYTGLEKYQEAISDYNKLLELAPNHVAAYQNRGQIYHQLEAKQQSTNDYNQAQDLSLDSAEKKENVVQEVLDEITQQKQRNSVKKAALSEECSRMQNSSAITQNFFFGIVSLDSQGNEINQEQKTVNQQIEDLGNQIKLEMVHIPGGNFIMGAPTNEPETEPYEQPPHQVSVEPFYLSKYPITQAQWQIIMGTNPAEFPGVNRPVENVSWYETVEFCDRLSEKIGTAYRLPSEAEWEYACRSSTKSPYHFGQTITTTVANYNGQYNYKYGPQGIHRQQTTDVGSFSPNGFGLFDMHGNVWEWCADPWHDNYHGAPSDGSVWELDGDNSRRVVRGGSWYLPPKYSRSACRASYVPDGKRWDCGFRVVFRSL